MTPDPSQLAKFEPYQTEVLFLLVGGNPLPNYVAAQVMAQQRANVYLLHTMATSSVAERLARLLGNDRPDLNCTRFGIPEADGPAIARKVDEITRQLGLRRPNVSVGLNFTGGTKPMAVYAALALRQSYPRAIFSYLDARTLSMVIDAGGPVQGVPAGRALTLKLDDLADLQGYRISRRTHASTPNRLLIAQAIRDVHLAPDGVRQWRDEWLRTWTRESTPLPTTLQPALTPVIQAFNDVCGGPANETGVAQALGFTELRQCGKYFAGEWLEDYTLAAVSAIKNQAPLDDLAAGLLIRAPDRPDFEIDVAATLGYQLFGISCIVTERKDQSKDHLFEVFTRADQLGGDEARFAVVSFYEKPEELERDVSQDWDAAGKIKVFGRQHIQDLSRHLLEWFRKANQEVT